MSFLNVKELQAREEAAWASPVQRALYSTRHIPGFPWHTVKTPASTGSSETPTATTVRRHVIPYDYPFTVFVKGRWVGRRLLEVYAEELPHHTPAYYEACLRTGRLYCLQRGALGRHNTQRRLLKRASAPTTTEKDSPLYGASASDNALDTLNVVLQHGDVVYHTVHRHEVPVIVGSSGVDPVYITAVCISRYGLLCVSKPTGLPTHATGRYMLNSLTALLEYVLAPKRLRAWLVGEDALMQSLVSTQHLSAAEKKELYDYYAVPHSTHKEGTNVSVGADHHEEVGEEEVDPDKAPRPCHRLDKVTSGVLLLAVHQDAAKRIGTALMHKAREVDAAVTAELETGGSNTGASTMEHTPVGAPSLQNIIGATYDLQKYYLARVVGTLCGEWKKKKKREASSADAAAARNCHCVWPLSGSENCLLTHNCSVQGMLASTNGVVRDVDADASIGDGTEDVSAGSFPGGVLITAPVAAVSAATLCQVLRTTTTTTNLPHTTSSPSCTEDAAMTLPAESVVLCTPYTGRLHQIRYHLSQLGCPIVGDVVYTPTASSEKSRTDGAEDAHVADEDCADMSHTWKRNDSDYLYFDPAQLPAAYRDLCELAKHETEGKGTVVAHTRMTLGVKRDRVEEEHDVPLLATSAAWQEEPPCYECAGRLPLVATKECATGTSAVCLHAWVYEIKESMLLQPQQVRQTSPLSHCEDGAGSSEGGTVASLTADVGGLRVVGGGFVRFEAPLPLWASSS